MSLRRKTFALFLILGISFCVGSYAVLKQTVYPAFEEFERESAVESLVRVTRMLDSDLRALEIMNVEYSAWDDTYEYVLGRRPDFADDNLDTGYWNSIDIDLIMIFDAQGREVYGWLKDPADEAEYSTENESSFSFGPGHPMTDHEATTDSLKGLLTTDYGIMQVVSYPIITTEAKGPIAGSLIVGELLTEDRVQDLGTRTTTDLSLSSLDDVNAPAGVQAIARRLAESGETANIEVDDGFLRAYQLLPDILGNPVAILEVTAPRKFTQVGTNIIQTTIIALAIASAIFILAALLFLQRLITTPVTRLTEQILKIRESGDLIVDVTLNRSDEVGVLAKEFGQLTSSLSDVRNDLEAARDEAVATSRAKSEFLARMSHEIRTPMNGVLGMTELLRDTTLTDKQDRFAKTIYESGESLLHIINDVLDISKIEAGRIEMDIAPFNLQHVIEECLELLAESAHRKGLELACDMPADINANVKGDPVRLRQILMNLVGNALKFTEQGEVVVRVTETHDEAEKAIYRFEIEDTGIGISLENLANVFEPFVQEDGSNTRRYGGTGLGLSISKQLVQMMGGEIGVRSAPGRGSTFWFTAELIEDQVTAAHSQPYLLVGKSAFVVDDNQTNREILRHQIEAWGMHVEVACSGSEAIQILRGGGTNPPQFDIMLLDMAMPGMDGLQLARAIRNEHEHRNTPIVILSSISRSDVDHETSAAGPSDWLAKPVRQARLYDTLLSLVSQAVVEPGTENPDPSIEDTRSVSAENSLNILLVDDNEVNLTVANEMLKSLGHQTTISTNGGDAVIAYKTQTFDVVLMDCQMPGMDGFEATQKIRDWEREQGRQPTPIVALTAHALQGDRESCLAAGMSDYLSKPFTKPQLSSVLGESSQANIALTTGNNGSSAESPSPFVAENRSDSKARILIVDDNDINRQVAQTMLESLGHEAVSAKDGDEALVTMTLNSFDAVLMDCYMPVRDGYDTARQIRLREEQSSQANRIPIVAVTADFLQSNRQRCIESGMDDYLAKPFTQEQLRMILDRWLVNSGTEESSQLAVDPDGFSELGETPNLASIDRAALDEIRQLDKSNGAVVLREIVVSYCASSTKLMLQLRSAVADADVELIEQLAHSLKGGSGQLGATLFASLCQGMISSVRANDLDGLPAKFEQAAIEHCAVLSGLDQELQNIAA